MKNITAKQIGFIKSLTFQTGAYQDGEGMIVDMKLYPRLDLEAALDGDATSYEASKIIETLLAAPKVQEAPAPTTEPSAKQISYATALLERQGRSAEELNGLTRREVSQLIDSLRAAA